MSPYKITRQICMYADASLSTDKAPNHHCCETPGGTWYRGLGISLLLATVVGCATPSPKPVEPAKPEPVPGAEPAPNIPVPPPVLPAPTPGTVSAAQMAAGMATPPTCGDRRSAAAGSRRPAREWITAVAPACLQLIKKYEAFEPRAYTGPAGKRLIGYGHTINASERFDSISLVKANALLSQDVASKASAVAEFISVPVSRNEFSALVCLAYNVGEGKLRRDSTVRQLNAKQYRKAADEMTTIRRANGKINPQLVKRRQAECSLFLTP
jgi:lysozyme